MPLQIEKFEIELRGLHQRFDARKTIPGTLSRCENFEIVKEGVFTIRRGYRRINTSLAVDNVSVRVAGHQLFHKLAVWREGVVVMAHSRMFAVVSRLSDIVVTGGTTGIADHGRIARSGVRSRVIATSQRSTDFEGSAGTP